MLCTLIVGHPCQNLEGFCFLMTWTHKQALLQHHLTNSSTRKAVLWMQFGSHAASHMLWSVWACFKKWLLLGQICLQKTMESQGIPCDEGRSRFTWMSLSNDPCPSLLACFTAVWSRQCLEIAVWLIAVYSRISLRLATNEVFLCVMQMYVTSWDALFMTSNLFKQNLAGKCMQPDCLLASIVMCPGIIPGLIKLTFMNNAGRLHNLHKSKLRDPDAIANLFLH